MRRAGYAAVDALAAPLAGPEADPVLRRANPSPWAWMDSAAGVKR